MRILYLIGNGFDLAQGLKTSYPHFYGEYVNSEPINPTEKSIINSITADKENWSDMEYALGRATKEMKDEDEFLAAYESLYDKLHNYLGRQEASYVVNNSERITRNIADPLRYITPRDYENLSSFVSGFSSPYEISIISFNYTNVLDRLLGYNYQPIELSSDLFKKVSLQAIIKVHGFLPGTVLMGVNDETQIANNQFNKSRSVRNCLIKPLQNFNSGQLVDKYAAELVDRANLIIIYGMSIGETDKCWWKRVANRLGSDQVRMVIFHHLREQIPMNKRWKEMTIKDSVIDSFLKVADVVDEKKEQVRNQIIVSFEDSIFNPNVIEYRELQ